MTRRWRYQGDVSLEHGGTFFDFSDWRHSYVSLVDVIDLDSACGFRGAVLIEEKTVAIDEPDRWPGALSTIGASVLPNGDIEDNGRVFRKGSLAWRVCLAYALNAYGAADTDRSEAVQPDRDCPDRFDGWQAKRIRSDGLRGYVRREFLGYRR